jgi:hypothetical protein
MRSAGRWTEQKALKYRYDPSLDPKCRGNHYVWEGGTGFGMRVYRTGRRTWICGTTASDRQAGVQRSRFFTRCSHRGLCRWHERRVNSDNTRRSLACLAHRSAAALNELVESDCNA